MNGIVKYCIVKNINKKLKIYYSNYYNYKINNYFFLKNLTFHLIIILLYYIEINYFSFGK